MDGVNRNYSINDTEPNRPIISEYSIIEKTINSIVSFICIGFGIVALIGLNRTRSTPKSARFLSSALIVFDDLAVAFFTLRKFVPHLIVNTFIQVIGILWLFLAYMTIGLMSLERLLIFYAPNFYLRKITVNLIKRVVFIAWATLILIYFFVRFGLCYIIFEDATIIDVVGRCNTASYTLYGVVIILTVLISFICYFKIVWILRSQPNVHSGISTFKTIRFYRSTSLVFVYIITITITSVAYILLITLKLETETLRISIDAVMYMNSILDPCTYIFWYKETRMEILKLFSCLHTNIYQGKIEQMRMEIFGIIVSEKRHRQIYPLTRTEADTVRGLPSG